MTRRPLDKLTQALKTAEPLGKKGPLGGAPRRTVGGATTKLFPNSAILGVFDAAMAWHREMDANATRWRINGLDQSDTFFLPRALHLACEAAAEEEREGCSN